MRDDSERYVRLARVITELQDEDPMNWERNLEAVIQAADSLEARVAQVVCAFRDAYSEDWRARIRGCAEQLSHEELDLEAVLSARPPRPGLAVDLDDELEDLDDEFEDEVRHLRLVGALH
jgi:hypothetical protein